MCKEKATKGEEEAVRGSLYIGSAGTYDVAVVVDWTTLSDDQANMAGPAGCGGRLIHRHACGAHSTSALTNVTWRWRPPSPRGT
jgi:hypothetical protein